MLDAERASRDVPRAIVSYERLVEDWRPVVAGLSAALGVTWPVATEVAASSIDAFLTPSMRHHAGTDADLAADPATSDWVKDAYAALHRLERDSDDTAATAALDAIGAAFDRVAPIFGAACVPELTARVRRAVQEGAAVRTENDVLRNQLEAARAALQAAQERLLGIKAERERMRLGLWGGSPRG